MIRKVLNDGIIMLFSYIILISPYGNTAVSGVRDHVLARQIANLS